MVVDKAENYGFDQDISFIVELIKGTEVLRGFDSRYLYNLFIIIIR